MPSGELTLVATEALAQTAFDLAAQSDIGGVLIVHAPIGAADALSVSALEHMVEIATGYSNLELDLETGERSRRDVHAEKLLLQLLRVKTHILADDSTKAVVVVNNCAAATFLALNSLAEGSEVIVSRGELVEIGGGFRIPEILAKSGARLREVGMRSSSRSCGKFSTSCEL